MVLTLPPKELKYLKTRKLLGLLVKAMKDNK
jgi:hypothetical protein